MGIEIPASQIVKPDEKRRGIQIKDILKSNPLLVAALGFDDLPNGDDVDGDLWVFGVDKDNVGVDIVFYDKDDPNREVEGLTGTGAFLYKGDARSGKQIKGDDEQTIINLAKCHAAGMVKVYIVGNIYKPGNLDWSKVPNAYLRIFPEGVSDRQGNLLIPGRENDIKAVPLTQVGSGSKCIVFGVGEFTGPNPLDWKFDPNPSAMPSLREGLAKFDINLPADTPV